MIPLPLVFLTGFFAGGMFSIFALLFMAGRADK